MYLDGIVAINKPYGVSISSKKRNSNIVEPNTCHKIVKMTDYNVECVLPHLRKELDVPKLIPCTGSEKSVQVSILVIPFQKCYFFITFLFIFPSDRFMTGAYIFGTSNKACEDINMALKRAIHMKQFKKYWAITIRVPNILKGNYHLGMRLQVSPQGNKKVLFLHIHFI